MKILIRNAKLIQSGHPHHNQVIDILTIDGVIRQIKSGIHPEEDYKVISEDNLHVSAGWMDGFANFCDPGDEYKEDIKSGSRAAAAGGFTDVMLIPNTLPVADNKSQIDYFLQKAKDEVINVHPIGSISQDTQGKALAEMYDMGNAGAVAFSDGIRPVQSPGVLLKSLEYVLADDRTIIQLPDNNSIGTHGQMSEGVVSTLLGLPGKPAIAEELMVARDIELLKYTGSKLHITGISTKKSLQLIQEAKDAGLRISCSVTPYHLFFCDEDLSGYDTNLKVNPPLRTSADREALIAGVKDGTIDFIASHHQPQDYDHKVCEFQQAAFGMETLEVVFAAAMSAGISPELFVKMQTENIRQIFGINPVSVREGDPAVLSLFNPDKRSEFTTANIYSKSINNAFLNHELQGQVYGILNKGRVSPGKDSHQR